MKIATLAALLAALALPIGASAQVVQPAPVQPSPIQAQGRQHNQAAAQYKRWTKRLAGLNLSSQQQQQVQSLLNQFAASHPPGSPKDKAGAHALRQQIFAELNPQQQAQLHQEIRAQKAQHMQRGVQGQPQPQVQVQPAPPLR